MQKSKIFTQNWFDQKWVKMPTQQIEIQVQVKILNIIALSNFFTHFWLYQKWVKIAGGLYNKKIRKSILYLI